MQEQGGFPSTLSPSPTNVPTPPGQTPCTLGGIGGNGSSLSDFTTRPPAAQSLPATPSAANVRTFTDYSGEHTRLTTLHGSTGALEVNNLGGFKLGSTSSLSNGSSSSKFASALESSIDGIVRTNSSIGSSMGGDFGEATHGAIRTSRSHLGLSSMMPSKHVQVTGNHTAVSMSMGPPHQNGMGPGMNGMGAGHMVGGGGGGGNGGSGSQFNSIHATNDDDMADVFAGLSFKEPSLVAAPGYGRARPRRSSAPVIANGDHAGGGAFSAIGPHYVLWGSTGGPGGGGGGGGGVGGGSSENPLPDVPRMTGGPPDFPSVATSRNSPIQPFTSSGNGSNANPGSFSAGIDPPHPGFSTAWSQANGTGGMAPQVGGGGGAPISTTKHLWGQSGVVPPAAPAPGTNGNSRPSSNSSQTDGSCGSSFHGSPIYSPTTSSSSVGFGGFGGSGMNGGEGPGVPSLGLLTTTPLGMGMGEERNESRSPFRVS